MEEDVSISRREIAKKLRISEDTVKEYIEKLKEKGLLRRVGPDKGGQWRLLRSKYRKEIIKHLTIP